jgi:hypothetical protein
MEVVEASGRASEVAFKFRRDGVEVWRLEHCCAVVDRDVLRTWLIHPAEQLVVDEVRFMAHAGERVAVSLPGVAVWVIDAGVLATLRRRV